MVELVCVGYTCIISVVFHGVPSALLMSRQREHRARVKHVSVYFSRFYKTTLLNSETEFQKLLSFLVYLNIELSGFMDEWSPPFFCVD